MSLFISDAWHHCSGWAGNVIIHFDKTDSWVLRQLKETKWISPVIHLCPSEYSSYEITILSLHITRTCMKCRFLSGHFSKIPNKFFTLCVKHHSCNNIEAHFIKTQPNVPEPVTLLSTYKVASFLIAIMKSNEVD